jgi:proteasome lid subunit RPN8/RPN11
VLGQAPVAFDAGPARAWLGLMALRRDGRDEAAPLGGVEPLWHAVRGAPYLGGFRAVAGAVSHEFPIEYFGDEAVEAGEALITEGRIERGVPFHYVPLAYAAPESRAARPEAFAVEEIPVASGVREGRLADALRGADRVRVDPPSGRRRDGDLPVLVPARVLDDAASIARRAGDVEAGGILIGALRFDPAVPEAFLEVTALIEAPHTRAAADHVTFTAETWSAVRGGIGLRARDERMVGWFHSHPAHAWCRECSDEARRRCRFGRGFFSADDRLLHRTVFPAAWSVGLLVTRTAFGEEIHTMFGWNEGSIEQRGYHVLRGGGTAAGDAPRAGTSDVAPCAAKEEHDAQR